MMAFEYIHKVRLIPPEAKRHRSCRDDVRLVASGGLQGSKEGGQLSRTTFIARPSARRDSILRPLASLQLGSAGYAQRRNSVSSPPGLVLDSCMGASRVWVWGRINQAWKANSQLIKLVTRHLIRDCQGFRGRSGGDQGSSQYNQSVACLRSCYHQKRGRLSRTPHTAQSSARSSPRLDWTLCLLASLQLSTAGYAQVVTEAGHRVWIALRALSAICCRESKQQSGHCSLTCRIVRSFE
jgi:hypothetical protein